jgi:hypothetical protein
MLSLELSAFDSLAGPHHRCHGTVQAVRGGRKADFHVILYDENGDLIGQAQLLGYPRWSEPLIALVARCIAKVLEGAPSLSRSAFRYASLDIRLNREQVLEVGTQLRDGKAYCEGWPIEMPTNEPAGPWQLLCWALAYVQWGTAEIPAIPAAVDPPVYYHDGTTYCRLGDLPDEARCFCGRWLWGQAVPTVPGVDDACFSLDMARFLGK